MLITSSMNSSSSEQHWSTSGPPRRRDSMTGRLTCGTDTESIYSPFVIQLLTTTFRLQDLEEKHQFEIKIYKQRLKHLMAEELNGTTQKKTNAEVVLKEVQDENREAEIKVKDEKRFLSNASRETEFSHEEYVRSLKREQDIKVTMLRHEFERRASEIQNMYEARMKETRDKLDDIRKDKIKGIIDKKQRMINDYIAQHQKALNDIKVYYSDITHNNLDLIKSLKEEVKDFEAEQKKDEQRKNEKAAENKRLSAPLKKSEEEVIRLRAELEEYKKEKKTLKSIKSNLEQVESSKADLLWELEVLQQKFVDLRRERDELRQSFMTSVFDVKQKCSFRGVLLEKKLTAIQMVQQEHEAQLNEVLSRANIDPTLLGRVKGRSGDVLQRKAEEVRKLENEHHRLKMKHTDLIKSVEKKLAQFGLRSAELGFESVLPSLK